MQFEFQQVVEEYSASLYRLACSYCGNRSDARKTPVARREDANSVCAVAIVENPEIERSDPHGKERNPLQNLSE